MSKANVKLMVVHDEASDVWVPAIVITDENFGELHYELIDKASESKDEALEILKWTKVALETLGLDVARRIEKG